MQIGLQSTIDKRKKWLHKTTNVHRKCLYQAVSTSLHLAIGQEYLICIVSKTV